MLKGRQRRMVEVRLQGNKYYESACFIFRRGEAAEAANEGELVEEARRIIASLDGKKKGRVWRRTSVTLLSLLIFTVGACAGFFVSFFF